MLTAQYVSKLAIHGFNVARNMNLVHTPEKVNTLGN